MPPLTLADLADSPERKILVAVTAKLRAEAQLSDVFRPIRMLENPTREAFLNYGSFEMVIQPFQVKEEDHPSQRETVKFGVMVSAYLPIEQTEEDSDLVGLDLGNFLRRKLWGLAVVDPAYPSPITFATTQFRQLTPLFPIGKATRILSYQAIFETDVDPLLGEFSA